MKNWMKWALGALGLGTGGFLAYKFVPLPGTNALGVGSVVKLRTFGRSGFTGLGGASLQITSKGGQPGTYAGFTIIDAAGKQIPSTSSTSVAFHPADIASVVVKSPNVPLLT